MNSTVQNYDLPITKFNNSVKNHIDVPLTLSGIHDTCCNCHNKPNMNVSQVSLNVQGGKNQPRFRLPIREFTKPLKDSTKKLHELLDETELLQLNDLFNKEVGRRMDRQKLKEVLANVAMIEYPDEKFEKEFLRINSSWWVLHQFSVGWCGIRFQ